MNTKRQRKTTVSKDVGEKEVKALWWVAEHTLATDLENGVSRAVMCLEAVLQISKHARLYPKFELETRLRLGDILSRGTQTLERARTHLERAVILINEVPAELDDKCLIYSLLVTLYLRTGNIPSAKKMVANGLDLAAAESNIQWVEYFQIRQFHCLHAEGRWEEGATYLLDIGTQARARGNLTVAVLCKQLEIQLLMQNAGWSREEAKGLLDACTSLLQELSSSGPSVGVQASDLGFMLDALSAFYLLKNGESKKAEKLWQAQMDRTTDDERTSVLDHWMPPHVRQAFSYLIAARAKSPSDTKLAREHAIDGETVLDTWLADSKVYTQNGEGVPPTVGIGCRSATSNCALQLKNALSEVAFQANISCSDYTAAARNLQSMKQVASTFKDLFQTDFVSHLAFLTAEYAYSTGHFPEALKWCAVASSDAEIGKEQHTACQLLRAQASLALDNAADCREALEKIQFNQSTDISEADDTETVTGAALRRYARAWLHQQDGQHQPAKLLGMPAARIVVLGGECLTVSRCQVCRRFNCASKVTCN
jgi:hypothetical protein